MTLPGLHASHEATTPAGRPARVTLSGCAAFGYHVEARDPATNLKAAGRFPATLTALTGAPTEHDISRAEASALAALDDVIAHA